MTKLKNKEILLYLFFLILFSIIIYLFIYNNFIKINEYNKTGYLNISGLCIELYVNAYYDGAGFKKTNFIDYPSFRQGDFLKIDEIRIYNKNESNYISNIYLNLFPEGGHTDEAYLQDYGEQRININQNLSDGDFYIINRTKNNIYYHFYNGEKIKENIIRGVELYKPGNWIFISNSKIKNNDGTANEGYTT